MRDRYTERNVYARLCRYAYTSSASDLCEIRFLDEYVMMNIRFDFYST